MLLKSFSTSTICNIDFLDLIRDQNIFIDYVVKKVEIVYYLHLTKWSTNLNLILNFMFDTNVRISID